MANETEAKAADDVVLKLLQLIENSFNKKGLAKSDPDKKEKKAETAEEKEKEKERKRQESEKREELYAGILAEITQQLNEELYEDKKDDKKTSNDEKQKKQEERLLGGSYEAVEEDKSAPTEAECEECASKNSCPVGKERDNCCEVGHHMQQNAANRKLLAAGEKGESGKPIRITAEGPALLMIRAHHKKTRTYGGKGNASMKNDKNSRLSPIQRQLKDIADVKLLMQTGEITSGGFEVNGNKLNYAAGISQMVKYAKKECEEYKSPGINTQEYYADIIAGLQIKPD